MHVGLEDGGVLGGGLHKLGAFYAERAKHQVGLIVTGGIAPNRQGKLSPFAAKLTNPLEVRVHRHVTSAVHSADSNAKIAMQILHAGRYAYHPFLVAPSAIKAPIGQYSPRALTTAEVEQTIKDYAHCASRAQEAGYDGVEIMGSEGYLINQFLVQHTNKRTDEWGGDYENRMRFPVEVVKAVRAAVGEDFIIIFRLSMLDLIPQGSAWEEVVALAKGVEAAGATIINTGIGWHEARIPTIATCVPRAGYAWVTKKLKESAVLGIPLCTTNRINMPEIAEGVLAGGSADLVSMARPFLADPAILSKAAAGKVEEINTCIACNQACLDHTFKGQRASCLVNPRAGYESELILPPVFPPQKKKVAVVGAGPAGLAFATAAAGRGHDVTLFEGEGEIGGQFNMAKLIPGKEEFHETIRYFGHQLTKTGVDVRLNTRVSSQALIEGGFEGGVVLATGVLPREVNIPGSNHEKVLSYVDVLRRGKKVGKKVAIIGAGGIGFDVAEFLLHDTKEKAASVDVDKFLKIWGIDGGNERRGGLLEEEEKEVPFREIYLLQRKKGKVGKGLGKTTGWIHRVSLKKGGVHAVTGVEYQKIDDEGLHVKIKATGETKLLAVDTIVTCAGQESLRELQEPLTKAGVPVFRIGGSEMAAELDAKRAIDQGTRLAACLENAKPGEVYSAPISWEAKIMKKLGMMQ
eukprot:evm.model.NODE_23858_length_7228_cov_28.074156.2